MVDARELRIGNIIKSPDTNDWVKVEMNHLIRIAATEEKSGYTPIELSEEWLIRGRFQEIGDIENYTVIIYGIGDFHLYVGQHEPKEYYMNVVKWDTRKPLQPHFKFVHQLQNIYYALTNQELQFTPTK